jgi:hypothetical protein
MTNGEQEFENGIIYHNKALAVIDDTIFLRNIKLSTLYNNMGLIYLNAKNDLAKSYFQKVSTKKFEYSKPYVYALLLDNQYAKFKLNESNGLPDCFINR